MCNQSVARKLLKNGKAIIHKRYPFTIRLKELKVSPCTCNYTLKIDYGSSHSGIAILRNNEILWLAQIHHKLTIVDALRTRASYRKSRHGRHTRYQRRLSAKALENRNKIRMPKGWFSPSAHSRVNSITNLIRKLRHLCPITNISYENVKFDTQLMQDPDISGVEYQQGTLKGYEAREYALEVWSHKCAYCGAKNVPLQMEHMIPKSRGGSNRILNMTISCERCNQLKDTKTPEEFGHHDVTKKARELYKKANESLRETSYVNSTRWKVYEALIATDLPVECGTGGRTKFNRIKLGLPKDHHFDAICVGASTPENLIFCTDQIIHIKALGRGNRQRVQNDKYGFPRKKKNGERQAPNDKNKMHFGIKTGDMVKATVPTNARNQYRGRTYIGRASCHDAKAGVFTISNEKGAIASLNHKYINVIQRDDGYEYSIVNIQK